MADTEIFNATIRAVDEASGPLRAIAAHMGALGRATETVGAHARGMAHLVRTAFGEAEEGGHHAAHGEHAAAEGAAHARREMHGAADAAHHASGEMHKLGDEAARTGHEIEHAAHPHAYEVLGGHINLLRTHFGTLRVGAGEFGHSLTEFLPMLAALGSAGSLVGLFELTEKMSDAYAELAKTATAAGVTAEQFNALSYAAQQTDVPVDQLSRGMFRLNRDIAEAAAGKNKDAASLFHHLGISLRDANGHLRSAAELLPLLAEAFKHTADPAMRARMAMVLFGRAGLDMLPLLMQGREELEKLTAAGQRVSFVPDKEAGEKLEEYHRSLLTLTAAVQGFGMEISTKLAPVLQPVIETMTDWIVANRDWIATGIASHVQELANWIGHLDMKAIIESMTEWGHTILNVLGAMGGFKGALAALALALGSPLLEGLAAAIGMLGTLRNVLVGLGAVLWANPILAAVGIVAVAAYELWQHWDAVKAGLLIVWEALKSAWHATADALVAALSAARLAIVAVMRGIGTGMMAALLWVERTIGEGWRAMARLLSDALGQAWTRMRPTIEALRAAAAAIIQAWAQVKQFFTDLWRGVGDAFRDAWTTIKPYIDDITGAVGTLRNGWIGRHLGLGESAPALGAAPVAPPATDPLHRSLYRPGGPAAAPLSPDSIAASLTGTVRTEITINGLPPGSTVRSTATGAAAQPDIDVGYSGAGLAGAY